MSDDIVLNGVEYVRKDSVKVASSPGTFYLNSSTTTALVKLPEDHGDDFVFTPIDGKGSVRVVKCCEFAELTKDFDDSKVYTPQGSIYSYDYVQWGVEVLATILNMPVEHLVPDVYTWSDNVGSPKKDAPLLLVFDMLGVIIAPRIVGNE